jgi:putative ABC transport system permease protein
MSSTGAAAKSAFALPSARSGGIYCGLVLGQGLTLAAIGTGIGLVVSMMVVRLMSSMLYGIKPTAPIAFAGSAALVILVALAASWIPARRAASIDPMKALRTE